MEAETIALIATTIGGVTAAIKAIAEARKARFEAEARIAESKRADEAEKTTDAIIRGVEKAKKTVFGETNYGELLAEEIRSEATNCGVEEKLNKKVKHIRGTTHLDRSKLMRRLEENGE